MLIDSTIPILSKIINTIIAILLDTFVTPVNDHMAHYNLLIGRLSDVLELHLRVHLISISTPSVPLHLLLRHHALVAHIDSTRLLFDANYDVFKAEVFDLRALIEVFTLFNLDLLTLIRMARGDRNWNRIDAERVL